ncbi:MULTISPECIES: PD-(D/E)XK motif protein [unclassified Maridesulfovibrio]|uniref:PD-(D/E)XK motif protein n=1 Tax=unclassified Maridesulfovibrio TaxID=2794999 RepID=UPI003B3D3E28
MVQQDYPWKSLSPSKSPDSSAVIAVDGAAHAFYWGKDHNGLPQLVCKLPELVSVRDKLPAFKGVDAHLLDVEGRSLLIMQLLDMAFEQLFYHLCLNLVESTKCARSADSIVSVVTGRLKRWQKLMGKKTIPGILTKQEQQGLIGELFFLRDNLFDWTDPFSAVECWVAPNEHPQDFALPGPVSVELKCRQVTSPEMVRISSAWQLLQEDGDLVLAILTLAKGEREGKGDFSLASLVAAIRMSLDCSPDALEKFEDALFSWGYMDLPEYNEAWWHPSSWRAYSVDESFPKLTVPELKKGIADVSYRLSLPDCKKWEVDILDLKAGF